MRTGIIIVAGGSGSRMGGGLPKQFRLLAGRPVLLHAIDACAEALPGAQLVVVVPEAYLAFWRNLSARFEVPQHTITTGGATRHESVRRGLEALPTATELIGVHDGARPLASAALIRRVAETAEIAGAAVPVIEPSDSFRTLTEEGSRPLDRSVLRAVQTPQFFRADVLRAAYEAPCRPDFTDDATVAEAAGAVVRLVEGERRNLKITAADDLTAAEALLRGRSEGDADDDPAALQESDRNDA